MTDQDPNNLENREIPIEDQNLTATPERHGCVTTWLIFMIIANSIVSLYYLFTSNAIAQALHTSTIAIGFLTILGCMNIVFSIMLLRWKKIGFYGFSTNAVITFF